MKRIAGKEVTAAVRTRRITVTEADVASATHDMDPENCAAAQAIKRAYKVDGVRVHRGVTYVLPKGGKRWEKYRTSGQLRLETIVFDRGGRFMLGEYDLLAPPVSMIVGTSLKKTRKPGATGKTAKLRTRRQVIPGVRIAANKKVPDETV